jgi:hypothetical protein
MLRALWVCRSGGGGAANRRLCQSRRPNKIAQNLMLFVASVPADREEGCSATGGGELPFGLGRSSNGCGFLQLTHMSYKAKPHPRGFREQPVSDYMLSGLHTDG